MTSVDFYSFTIIKRNSCLLLLFSSSSTDISQSDRHFVSCPSSSSFADLSLSHGHVDASCRYGFVVYADGTLTDVACKGMNRLHSSFGAASSSSSHLSQSDANSADTAGMGLWCMVMVQSRMWHARALME